MQGWGPLHCAVESCQPGMLKLLLTTCNQTVLDATCAEVKSLIAIALTQLDFASIERCYANTLFSQRCCRVSQQTGLLEQSQPF